jgi:hypothetical protein
MTILPSKTIPLAISVGCALLWTSSASAQLTPDVVFTFAGPDIDVMPIEYLAGAPCSDLQYCTQLSTNALPNTHGVTPDVGHYQSVGFGPAGESLFQNVSGTLFALPMGTMDTQSIIVSEGPGAYDIILHAVQGPPVVFQLMLP